MKKVLLLVVFFLLLTTRPSFAHGGPPFTMINGAKTVTNPLFSGSNFFKITYEVGPQNYLVNQTLNFSMDTSLLPVDPNQLSQTKFYWNFGDGQEQSGLSASHKYVKSGSFDVSLKVTDPNTPDPVEIESVKLNVLPVENYKLPEAVISADGKAVVDALKNPLIVKNGQKVSFDATKSTGTIKSYEWDFGDGTKEATGTKLTHNFDFSGPYSYSFFPILRVTDDKGFTSETTVQVTNETSLSNGSNTTTSQAKAGGKNTSFSLYLLIGAGVILAVGGGLVFLKMKKPV